MILLPLAAFTILFLALWIVVPSWTSPLFVLAVGAPELSPWLFLAGLVLCVTFCVIFCLLSARSVRRSPWNRISLVVALCATVLTAIPLVQAASTPRRFDEAMRAALGSDVLRSVPANMHGGMRPYPIVPVDLFRSRT